MKGDKEENAVYGDPCTLQAQVPVARSRQAAPREAPEPRGRVRPTLSPGACSDTPGCGARGQGQRRAPHRAWGSGAVPDVAPEPWAPTLQGPRLLPPTGSSSGHTRACRAAAPPQGPTGPSALLVVSSKTSDRTPTPRDGENTFIVL